MKTSLLLSLLSLITLVQAQITMPERAIGHAKAGTTVTGLTTITGVQMNAAIASIDTTSTTPYFMFSNVRATSKTTTMSDLLRVRYPVSKTSLDLKSAQVEIFKNIGIFDEINTLFINNVPAIAPMKYGTAATPYASDYYHRFTDVNGTKPFVFDLVACQSLGFVFDYLSTPCYIVLTRSATPPKATEYTSLVATDFRQSRLGVLDTGKYYLWMKPQTGTTATVQFGFVNENAGSLGTAANNSYITTSLRGDVRDYAKWKIRLLKDQDLVITQNSGSNIQWRVIADDSTQVGLFFCGGGYTTFSPLVNAPRTGDYYLIAEKTSLTSSAYVGASISIAP
jgi:hypothetical protein